MRLEHLGHPLHTRGLSVTSTQRDDAKLDVFGELIDLRKRGFVPVSGKLQPAGIVHHMQLRAVVDPETLVLESLVAAQPAVAFEPSEAASGESCRDPAGRLETLAGERLDAGFAKRLGGAFGGGLGCSHLLVLTHLLASTMPRAVHLERERAAGGRARAAGSRIFRRDLIVDGAELPDRTLQLAVQLTDLHLAPVTGVVQPMEHFAGQLELRVLAGVDLRSIRLASLAAAERSRTRADLDTAEWRDRSTDVERWVGTLMAAGIGGKLVRAYGESHADRPLLDALLNLTPGMHQCMAVMDEGRALTAMRVSTVMGMGGIPDSCYMWRTGGALDRLRRSASNADAADAVGAR
jgi:hypothetical protein